VLSGRFAYAECRHQGTAWHASIGGAMELGVELVGELVDCFGEQVESTVEDFAATVLDAAGIGEAAQGDRAVRQLAGQLRPGMQLTIT